MRSSLFVFAAVSLLAGAALAESISGGYVEARNAEMWTGPCTHNAQLGLVGDKAIMAWKVDQGVYEGVRLDGLAVAAVVYGDGTFGSRDKVRSKAVIVVDDRASKPQQESLVKLAQKLAGDTIQEIVSVRVSPVELEIDHARKSGYSRLETDIAQIRTRRMYPADHTCASQRMVYPVLASVSDEYGAFTIENVYHGREFKSRFDHANTCSAVIAKFSL